MRRKWKSCLFLMMLCLVLAGCAGQGTEESTGQTQDTDTVTESRITQETETAEESTQAMSEGSDIPEQEYSLAEIYEDNFPV